MQGDVTHLALGSVFARSCRRRRRRKDRGQAPTVGGRREVRHRGQQTVSGRAGTELREQRGLPILSPLQRRQVPSGAAGAFMPLGFACDDERCRSQRRRRRRDGVPDGDEVVATVGLTRVQGSVKQLESSEQLVGDGSDVSGGGDTVDEVHEGRAGLVVVAHDAAGRQCARIVGSGLVFLAGCW